MRTTLSAHTGHKRLLIATMIAVCFPGSVTAGDCLVGRTVSPNTANMAFNFDEVDLVADPGSVTVGTAGGAFTVNATMPSGLACDLNEPEMWFVAVGDDTGSLSGNYSGQNFGGFDGATVGSISFGDWSKKDRFCLQVENPTANEAFVELWFFRAESRDGVGRFIRSFTSGPGEWVPAATTDDGVTTNGSLTICVDTKGDDRENITGLGLIVGAFPPNCDEFCRRCALCRFCDDDDDDVEDCPTSPGCPTNDTTPKLNKCQDLDRDCIAASRESSTVSLLVTPAAPNMVIDVDLGTDGVQAPGTSLGGTFQAGEERTIGIENNGVGPLTLDIKITGADASQFRVVGSSLLAAWDSKVVEVTYAPDEITQSGSPHVATLMIFSDDPDECPSTDLDLSGETTTNLRLAVSGRQTIKACVVLTVLAPPTDILSVGTRVAYDASTLEFVGVKPGPALTIIEAIPDDPDTPDIDESEPAEVWEIIQQEAVNGVVSVTTFDQGGRPIVLTNTTGDIFELFCVNFKFIVPPACDDPVTTDFDFGGGPRDGFFPDFDNFFTSSPAQTGQPVQTEVTSLVDGSASIAANQFVRGDTDFDEDVDFQDANNFLDIVFGQGMLDRNCAAVLDANDDGRRDVIDALTIIQTAFLSSTVQPASPFPLPGSVIASGDDQNSELGCKEGLGCEF